MANESQTCYIPNTKLPRLIYIEYPGTVKNIDAALETLGGIDKISEVYLDSNRRLELRFRPSDKYCKPTCGERHNSTSVLIKVTRRRKIRKKKVKLIYVEENAEPLDSYEVKPMGIVNTTFKFDKLCDFQYLPVSNSPDGTSLKCIYDSLLPKGIILSSWLEDQSPLFLPPATFSRMDAPQDYRYRRDATEVKTKIPQNIICRTREKRTHFALFQNFKDEGVPTRPLKGAISQIRYKLIDSGLFRSLKEEFNKRPIWSKNALRVRLKFSKDKLKCLLPTVAYYFPTGPWRNLWVVFGYDPRKDPTSWLYQTFDFRIRQAGGCKTKVEAKRSSANYILPYKSVQHTKRKVSVIKSFNMDEDNGDDEKESSSKNFDGVTEEFYVFRPGMVPPYRQMFYQYCDVHVPEIQTLLETAILSGANKVCSEKNGWLPAGVEIKCRDILSNLIEKTITERSSEGKNLEDEELMSDSEIEDDSLQEGISTEDET